jgi:hypothetical protein
MIAAREAALTEQMRRVAALKNTPARRIGRRPLGRRVRCGKG